MDQLQDLRDRQAETKSALASIAASQADTVRDLDKLITLAQTPSVDLADVVAAATEIRDNVQAIAQVAQDTAGKYDSGTTDPNAPGVTPPSVTQASRRR